MFDNVMVDLETLDNTPTSAIVSVGAVKFDPVKKVLGDTFFRIIPIDSAMQYGTVSGKTLKWWMEQDDIARNATFNPSSQQHVYELPSVLRDFEWFLNGAAFDNVILRHAYDNCSLVPPWQFWNDRCYRTLKGMYPQIKMGQNRTGTHHNALDDAISQTKHLFDILKVLP